MNKLKWFFIILVIALAGAAAWYFFLRKEDKPAVLITEKPEIGYISKSVTATGTIQPVDTVTVGSQVSGTIKAIYTDFNAKVRKGQLIAELDKSLFEAQVNQFRANLDVSKSTLVYQKSNFDRQTLLYNSGAISKADFENAQNLYQTAKANVESVQAQLDASDKNLSYASIYSPVDGVVMTRNISVGQTVAASFSTPTLFVIAKDITRMQVQAAVSEADIGDVLVGQRVTFTVDAYPDITFTGRVNQIRLEPIVTANVVTYSTIITAPNDDLKLRPGMTANIFVFTKEVDSALLIPAKALKFTPDPSLSKQFVLQAAPEEKAGSTHTRRGGGARTAGSAKGAGVSGGSGTAANSGATPGSREKTGATNSATDAGTAGAGRNGGSAPGAHDPSRDTAGQEIDTSKRAQHAFVWVKVGDTLQKRRIRIGLNDDTHVEVLKGLTEDDEIVTGVEIPVKGAATTPATRSPFMPARRGGGSAKPAGGGAGGGGGRPGGGGGTR